MVKNINKMWIPDKGVKRKTPNEKEKAWQLRSYIKNTVKESESQSRFFQPQHY